MRRHRKSIHSCPSVYRAITYCSWVKQSFYNSGEKNYFLRLLGADDRHTPESVFIESNYVNKTHMNPGAYLLNHSIILPSSKIIHDELNYSGVLRFHASSIWKRAITHHNIKHIFYLCNVVTKWYLQTWSLTYTYLVWEVHLQTFLALLLTTSSSCSNLRPSNPCITNISVTE